MTYIPEWIADAAFLLATTAGLIVFADCVVRWGDAFAKLRPALSPSVEPVPVSPPDGASIAIAGGMS